MGLKWNCREFGSRIGASQTGIGFRFCAKGNRGVTLCDILWQAYWGHQGIGEWHRVLCNGKSDADAPTFYSPDATFDAPTFADATFGDISYCICVMFLFWWRYLPCVQLCTCAGSSMCEKFVQKSFVLDHGVEVHITRTLWTHCQRHLGHLELTDQLSTFRTHYHREL